MLFNCFIYKLKKKDNWLCKQFYNILVAWLIEMKWIITAKSVEILCDCLVAKSKQVFFQYNG